MSTQISTKAFLLYLTLAFVSQVAYNYYFGNKSKKKKEDRKEVNEVIMFTHGVGQLKKSKYSRCVITKSMDRLLLHLSSPRQTLDICMYVFTNLDLANVIMKLHYRGIKIRLIIDADMAYTTGSHVKKFEKQKIPVRWMKSTNLMHHKFCLIDASTEHPDVVPLVISGSLNWTNQALNGNWEDVTITSQRQIVEQYRVEFEKLWIQFKPIVDF